MTFTVGGINRANREPQLCKGCWEPITTGISTGQSDVPGGPVMRCLNCCRVRAYRAADQRLIEAQAKGGSGVAGGGGSVIVDS